MPNTANPNANYFELGQGGNSTPIELAKPVASLSSVAGQNITNQNTQTLQKIESNYAGPSIVDYLSSGGKASDFASREKLAGQAGIKDYTGTAEQNTSLLKALRNVSGSPASQTMVDEINGVAGGGTMTDTERQGLQNLQDTQDSVTTAAAKARAALES